MMVVILPPIWNLDRILNMCSSFLDKTFTMIASLFQSMVSGHKVVWMFLLRRLGFWRMREVHEEFDEDNYYVGLVNNRPPLSFCVAVNYHEGYMLILRPGDETYMLN